MYARLLDLYLC